MHPRKILKTSNFRLTIFTLLIFWGVFCVIIFFLIKFFLQSLSEQADIEIEDRASYFFEQAVELTPEELKNLLADENEFYHSTRFELIGIAGDNVPEAPDHEELTPIQFLLFSDEGVISYDFELENGSIIRISQDIGYLSDTMVALRYLIFWSIIVTFFLVLLISLFLSGKTYSPLESINHACREITQGRLSRRVPHSGAGDDFDKLAININTMMDQIESLLSELRQVTDDIAHDLRTPITRIRSQLELLQATPSGRSEEIEHVIGEVDRLQRILDSLLRISRLEGGISSQAFQVFDMLMLIENLDELYRPSIENKNITFVCHLPDKPFQVVGDSGLWMQALANLLDNAIKYTPVGGKITLSLIDGKKSYIEIKDSGPGIPFYERENVFKRFYRLEKHRLTEGNGLGLSLVKAICELHNATVSLSGEQGLTVTIMLVPRPTAFDMC